MWTRAYIHPMVYLSNPKETGTMNHEDMTQLQLEATRVECLKLAAKMIDHNAGPAEVIDYAEKLLEYVRAK